MKASKKTLTKGAVLLVSDAPSRQDDLIAALEAEHYEVFRALDEPQAARMIQTTPIEVVIFDARGRSAETAPLPASWAVSERPFCTVLIVRSLESLARAESAGADALLVHPVEAAWLVSTVNRLLADLRAASFRSRLLQRHTAPFAFATSPRHWGLNE